MARSDRAASPDTPGKKRQNRDNTRIVVAVVVLVLLIAFVLDNRNTVPIGFVFFHVDIRLIWVLLIAAFLGALVDRLVMLIVQRRRDRAENRDR
jgi:uncharacterized integral membrane protein